MTNDEKKLLEILENFPASAFMLFADMIAKELDENRYDGFTPGMASVKVYENLAKKRHHLNAKPDRFSTGCDISGGENYGITGYQEPAKDTTAG